MADVANTLRYRTGTVSVTQNSTTVTGQNTRWASAGINPGADLYLDGIAYANEIKSVDSDTKITLVKPYIGASASLHSYSIDRHFNASTNAAIAARQAALLGDFELIRDGNVVNITGKDAYEVYKDAGGTKTKTQWKNVFDANELAVDKLEELAPYMIHNAGSHNSHYRGKVLTFDDALSAAIQAGTFGGTYGGKFVDVYVGDSFYFEDVAFSYKDENNETQSGVYTGRFRVADLDYFKGCGDTELTAHHIVVVPDSSLYNCPMNKTKTTEGGYAGSYMRTVGLRRASAIIRACFGSEHVITHREYLVNSVVDGEPMGGAWFDSNVEIMDERQVYGSLILDSGNPTGGKIPQRYSVACKQFNVFRHRPDLISNRHSYWLRNVVSEKAFALVYQYGDSIYREADNEMNVRPYAVVA